MKQHTEHNELEVKKNQNVLFQLLMFSVFGFNQVIFQSRQIRTNLGSHEFTNQISTKCTYNMIAG